MFSWAAENRLPKKIVSGPSRALDPTELDRPTQDFLSTYSARSVLKHPSRSDKHAITIVVAIGNLGEITLERVTSS